MAGEVAFLTLAIQLAQATTCPRDNCTTGLIITGGRRNGKTIETLPPAAANCNIPPFPEGRWAHSLSVLENGQLVVCGGGETRTSCVSWRNGQDEWTHYATLSRERYYHAAVSINNIVIIVGGSGLGQKSGEIVNEGGALFTLQSGGWGTCALPFSTGFLTIGGAGNNAWHGKVDRYDSEGKYLGSLPDLATPRMQHACTSFFSNGEQALLVAGGQTGRSRTALSTTEIYLPSTNEWTTGGNLPRAMYGLTAAHLKQQAVVTGGYDNERNSRDEVLQYNPSNNAWAQIGSLKNSRRYHAVAEVNLAAFGCVADTSAATTTGLDPLLALLICLVLVCWRGCNNSCTLQGENKQSQ